MTIDQQPPALTRRELREREQAALTRPVVKGTTKAKTAVTVKRHRSIASKGISFAALLFAGILVVAVSVPSNLFVSNTSAVAEVVQPAETVDAQSFKVSSEAQDAAPARDSFEAISYAQTLALKYAGVDYSYDVTSGAVRWPFPYAVPITDGFGDRDGGFHKGVDFVPGAGTPIYAIADGVVTTATFDNSGYGQHVVLQHNLAGVDVESLYGHMIEGSSPVVVGQEVKVGDFLGLVGDTGVAYGAHLHFEIHIDKVPVDPFAWLQANAVN